MPIETASQQPKPAAAPRRRLGRWIVVLLMALAGAYAAYDQKALQKLIAGETAKPSSRGERAPIPVTASLAIERSEPVIINGLGTVQAWNTVVVRARVDGTIEKINFEEGAMVRAGDTLITLDQRPFIAARDQAAAKVKQDEALLVSAKADLERTTRLQQNGYATAQLRDQQTAAVKQLESQIAADKAALENAEAQLSYTVIQAPIGGRIGLRKIDIGNLVRASDSGGAVTITQIQPIAVLFTAPEQYLGQIVETRKSGPLDAAAYTTDDKTRLADGKLDVIDNTIDVNTGTIRLKARFENDQDSLWPGQSVNTRLTIATLKNAVVVPDSAVMRGPTGPFAYVVKADKTAELREIEVTQIQEGWAVIAKGIGAGEQVVTSGQYKVQPGSPLNVAGNSSKSANARTAAQGLD